MDDKLEAQNMIKSLDKFILEEANSVEHADYNFMLSKQYGMSTSYSQLF
jgi:hypothetical protein